MRDLGYTEGQNVKYELRTDETEPARLAEAAKGLASIPVDVIVANGTPASQAAKAATQTIPIVMVSVGDPIRAGFVASLAHPGGNITGTSFLGPDLAAKRLQILKQVIPSTVRVAFLFNPNNASNVIFRDEIETATSEQVGGRAHETQCICFVWSCGGAAHCHDGPDDFSRDAYRRRCWQFEMLRQRRNRKSVLNVASVVVQCESECRP